MCCRAKPRVANHAPSREVPPCPAAVSEETVKDIFLRAKQIQDKARAVGPSFDVETLDDYRATEHIISHYLTHACGQSLPPVTAWEVG